MIATRNSGDPLALKGFSPDDGGVMDDVGGTWSIPACLPDPGCPASISKLSRALKLIHQSDRIKGLAGGRKVLDCAEQYPVFLFVEVILLNHPRYVGPRAVIKH
jgi:hypothetical protein